LSLVTMSIFVTRKPANRIMKHFSHLHLEDFGY